MQTKLMYEIKQVKWPEKRFAIRRATLSFDKLSDFFKKNYDAIYAELAKQGINPTDPPCAFYYRVDERKQETDLAAAVPIPANADNTALFEVVNLPACTLITTTYFGHYEEVGSAYEEMEAYLKAHNMRKGLVIEEYLTDPLIEKDSSKWQTNIYFVVS